MDLDAQELDELYSYMPQDHDLGSQMMDVNVANSLQAQMQMQPSMLTMDNGNNINTQKLESMMEANELDDAIIEESIREYRRQSMASFALQNYMDFGDQQGITQAALDASVSNNLANNLGNDLSSLTQSMNGDILQTMDNRAMPMLDMPHFHKSSIPQMPSFMSNMGNQVARKDAPTSNLDAQDDNIEPFGDRPSQPAESSVNLLPQYNTKSIKMDNIYSSSGFDMIGLLMRVATRPNPEVNIGAVDMSCAFVVCDARKFDCPIIYCSATFERLTGYTKHEILGRNCRFLQSPDGIVTPGVKRKYVDDDAVYYLKSRCERRDESQISLINYRKGGQPFMNLLTTIPITWDSPDIAYFVGFQVDLVDQPGSIMNQSPDGHIVINYQHRNLPQYLPVSQSAESRTQIPGTTVPKEDVSRLLTSLGSADSEMSRRVWDKVLLENTDDVVHVLSLKGLFLYCSPSTRKILEYDPNDLVGSALSTVCHPSDIVPVTRDLKDTSSGTAVNVVFRIRRKFSGYTWFESYGCLHTEQGKGRKCIILIGRERPVYMLQWKDVNAAGGIGENEIWTKISQSGMFLFVSTNSKTLLDRESEELMGISLQSLMRPDSRLEVNRALENARSGKQVTVRHEIQSKRGQYLQVVTTFYPEQSPDKGKPTFLIAQTRLVKHTRPSMNPKQSSTSTIDERSMSVTSSKSTPTSWSASPATTVSRSSANSALLDRSSDGATPENNRGGGDDDEENIFEELKTTRSSSWQFELRQMQRTNKRFVEELNGLLAIRKKRKRRNGADQIEKECANCHTRVTPEWRRGPSGKRDLCNSCGLRYAKLVGRVSPRTQESNSNPGDAVPRSQSPLTNPSMNVEATSTAEGDKSSSEDITPLPTSNPSNSHSLELGATT